VTQRLIRYAMIGVMVFLWGVSFVVTKIALDWLGPTALAFLRWTITSGVLLGWLVMSAKLPPLGALLRRDGWSLAGGAVLGITLYYATANLALRYTTATNAGVLSNLISVFLALLATVWLHERLAPVEWLALAAAFGGAVLVSQGAGHLRLGGSGLRGDLLLVLAAVFGAVYSLDGKRLLASYPVDVVTTGFALLGALFLLPAALWEGLSLNLPPAAWAAILFLGLGSGALANLLWMYLLATTNASRAGMTLFLIPVTSTALAVIVLHEPLTPVIVFGAGLVLTSVAIVEQRRLRRKA